MRLATSLFRAVPRPVDRAIQRRKQKSEAEIWYALEAYLRGGATRLKELRSFLLDRTLDKPDAPPVAHVIEYLIDEAASGAITRFELDAELRALARTRKPEYVWRRR
jgi:hypothetical protein